MDVLSPHTLQARKDETGNEEANKETEASSTVFSFQDLQGAAYEHAL
jgi:hypothetical protein